MPGFILFIQHVHRFCHCSQLVLLLLTLASIVLTLDQDVTATQYFYRPNVTHFARLYEDRVNRLLFVGARDHLLSFDLQQSSTLKAIQVVNWMPSNQSVRDCEVRGQPKHLCHNFVNLIFPSPNGFHLADDGSQSERVSPKDIVWDDEPHTIDSNDRLLLVCGTNAFRPNCTWRSSIDLNLIRQTQDGHLKTSRSPAHQFDAMFSSDGDFFYAGPSDAMARQPVLMRDSYPWKAQQVIRTGPADAKELYPGAQFVKLFESESFVYFAFRELAVEHSNCGPVWYSRLGRLCKREYKLTTQSNQVGHDVRSKPMLRSKQHSIGRFWSTLVKARLNCSLPGKAPLTLNELHDIAFDSATQTLIGSFGSSTDWPKVAALCAFDLQHVNAVFDGLFLYQQSAHSTWEPTQAGRDERSQFMCSAAFRSNQNESASPTYMERNRKLQLMAQSIQPIHQRPIAIELNGPIQQVAVDSFAMATNSNHHIQVVFAVTKSLSLRRYVRWPNTLSACLLEDRSLSNVPGNAVLQLLIQQSGIRQILIGTEHSLIRMPLHLCDGHATRSACLASRDPYCAWSRSVARCLSYFEIPAEQTHRHVLEHVAPASDCGEPDQYWSSWSEFEACAQQDDWSGMSNSANDEDVEEEDDDDETDASNQARPRLKRSLRSLPDGCLCSWRECFGSKCSNRRQIRIANCTRHGGWTEWSDWSECSVACGSGTITRRRSCSSPTPKFGGRTCDGLDVEQIPCTSNVGCAPQPITVNESKWSDWNDWSGCSTRCGSGVRSRNRTCTQESGLGCRGPHTEYETCDEYIGCREYHHSTPWSAWYRADSAGILTDADNGQPGAKVAFKSNNLMPKQGQLLYERFRFSCRAAGVLNEAHIVTNIRKEQRLANFSSILHSGGGVSLPLNEWTPCGATCGVGYRFRRMETGEIERSACDAGKECRGWSEWSEWTDCRQGHRSRIRVCYSASCDGSSLQTEPCLALSNQPEVTQVLASNGFSILIDQVAQINDRRQLRYSNNHLLIIALISFGSGCLFGCILFACLSGRSLNCFHCFRQPKYAGRFFSLRSFAARNQSRSTIDNPYVNNSIAFKAQCASSPLDDPLSTTRLLCPLPMSTSPSHGGIIQLPLIPPSLALNRPSSIAPSDHQRLIYGGNHNLSRSSSVSTSARSSASGATNGTYCTLQVKRAPPIRAKLSADQFF